MNLKQSEQCWIIMRWGMPGDYRHPKPSYFNRCIDKISDAERPYYKMMTKEEYRKQRQDRLKEISRLMSLGKSSTEAYDIMLDANQLELRGLPVCYGRFRALCTAARKELGISKETKKDQMKRLMKNGLSDNEIVVNMGITKGQSYKLKSILKREMNNV